MDFWPRGIEKVKKFNIVVGDYFGGIPDPRYSLSNKLDLQGQNLSDIETRFDLLLKRTEILILTATAVSLKILCDLVDEDGFECLMKLTLDYLTELEYLINTTDGVPQSAFPAIEFGSMDSLYIPCVEHAKQWLSNSNHPIIQSIPIRMLLMLVHGSMVPVQVEGSDEQYQQAPLFAVGTSIGANILIPAKWKVGPRQETLLFCGSK
ncbi:hypothetical protein TEA_024012 [Camellia sinensis var. sinensis]|uniref:Uncharacterized protein n=1 Tax=Camellia sinensis var. sinensis TaxID=542762 RepID=A0A4V3WP01_CAMSN|nr:hypothetical protein TEA_024012 [Camellia sinensis var. sinensis]